MAVVAVSLAIGAAILNSQVSDDGFVAGWGGEQGGVLATLSRSHHQKLYDFLGFLDSKSSKTALDIMVALELLKHGGRKCSSIHLGCHGCLRSVRHGCKSTYIVKTTNIC